MTTEFNKGLMRIYIIFGEIQRKVAQIYLVLLAKNKKNAVREDRKCFPEVKVGEIRKNKDKFDARRNTALD